MNWLEISKPFESVSEIVETFGKENKPILFEESRLRSISLYKGYEKILPESDWIDIEIKILSAYKKNGKIDFDILKNINLNSPNRYDITFSKSKKGYNIHVRNLRNITDDTHILDYSKFLRKIRKLLRYYKVREKVIVQQPKKKIEPTTDIFTENIYEVFEKKDVESIEKQLKKMIKKGKKINLSQLEKTEIVNPLKYKIIFDGSGENTTLILENLKNGKKMTASLKEVVNIINKPTEINIRKYKILLALLAIFATLGVSSAISILISKLLKKK